MYNQCTSDMQCLFANDGGFNIEITGNSPTPNTIPAQINTEQQIKIGAGHYSVTDTKNYLSSRAGKELIPKCFINLFPH